MARPVNLDDELDVIEELQLRRWARENYSAPELREESQHPVVRDEMRLRDEEMIIETRARDSVVSFVPLAPTVIQKLHNPHDLPDKPVQSRDQQEAQTKPPSVPQWLC